jgi:hypothetical protein
MSKNTAPAPGPDDVDEPTPFQTPDEISNPSPMQSGDTTGSAAACPAEPEKETVIVK